MAEDGTAAEVPRDAAADQAEEAEEHAVALLETALRRARDDTGEGLSASEIREATGLGGADMKAACQQLLREGKVAEYLPGSLRWRLGDDVDDTEEMAEARAVAAADTSADVRAALAELGVRPEVIDQALNGENPPNLTDGHAVAAAAQRAGARWDEYSRAVLPTVDVRLPLGVAEAMEPATLGDMVAKGIVQAKAQQCSFRLVVE